MKKLFQYHNPFLIKSGIIFFLIICSNICHAQYRKVLIKDTTLCKNCPYLILETADIAEPPSRNCLYNPAKILGQKMLYYPKQGLIKPDSIEVIRFEKGTKIVDLAGLMKIYKLREEYANLPVYIDSVLVFNSKRTYFELSAIKYVKVRKEKGTNTKYISVASIFHTNNPIADVYIYGTYTRPQN